MLRPARLARAQQRSGGPNSPRPCQPDGDLAAAEPKKLRYRLLHIAARITRTARRTRLRIAEHWPWTTDLVTAFDRLTALPRPLT